MTLEKLAALAHVSVSTVSKAFSGSSEISEETKQMIFSIAKEKKCFEKYYKGIYPKKVIGIICPELQSRLYGNYMQLFDAEISRKNATTIIASTDFTKKKEVALLEYMTKYLKADGIVLMSPFEKDIGSHTMPIVSIGSREGVDSVSPAFEKSIFDAIKHFYDNGHRKIGFVGDKFTSEKEEHYYSAMKKLGLLVDPDFVVTSEKRFEHGGYKAVKRMLKNKKLPAAILAAYDYIAIGLMNSLNNHGFHVPEDVSVIGMDDLEESQYLSVPLTSIKTYIEDACSIATDILFKKIENPYFTACQIVQIPTTLVKRKSVAKASR